MAAIDLIDTTEMYLKTIYEMAEDGVVPLRARIVERLGHSGPTVSQTIGRMERSDLVTVREDRKLELTERGYAIAREVMRKHRLAECLLLSVIGLDLADIHEEACRWEHVMSTEVEDRLVGLLNDPKRDPFGNSIPGALASMVEEVNVESICRDDQVVESVVTRIGEPIQADRMVIKGLLERGIKPGARVAVSNHGDAFVMRSLESQNSVKTDSVSNEDTAELGLSSLYAPHLFLEIPKKS